MMLRQLIGAVTGRPGRHPYPEHMRHNRRIAADGMVLLKNDADVLPLKPGRVALFGAGAVDTVTCGTGSGHVFAPYTVSVLDGLKNAGFSVTSNGWLNRFAAADRKANKDDKTLNLVDRRFSGQKILIDELPISDEELRQARAADIAVYVIRRNAGENHDRLAEPGDYYLSDAERSNLAKVAAAFGHTVVVLNTCVIDANFINELPGIHAAILMGAAGNESGDALADVITGAVCPSGRLTDTWAKQYRDNPASATFSRNDGDSQQEDYNEDIFVGYRWFDTFGIEPLYPFGYGLSYTSFETAVSSVVADWSRVEVTVQVTNKGAVSGREVVQAYVTAPQGRLPKPFQELKGFAKSRLLKPGEAQTLTISFPTETLASYDTAAASFNMEAGDYLVRVGSHSRNTAVAAVVRLDGDAVLRTVRNNFALDRELHPPTPPVREPETTHAPVLPLAASGCVTVAGASRIERRTPTWIPEGTRYSAPAIGSHYDLPFACEHEAVAVTSRPESTLPDVKAGKASMEEFVASLEPEVLVRLVAGKAEQGRYATRRRMKTAIKVPPAPGSSGATTTLFAKSLGIPPSNMTDGPAGLHIVGCAATSWPVGMVVAQTWDVEHARLMGLGMGKELAHYHHGVILGPGMNIHRDPLCGRNFEYYSEDPLLTGKLGAAVTVGVQTTPGSSVSIKHFAANNQEEDRTTSNSTVSERALREIYLRGFEICVRESAPNTVMSSYNKINGVHTSSHYELLTDVLRGEWGFQGLVMTDWGSESDKALDLHAGNDLIMGGYRPEFLLAALEGTGPQFGESGFVAEEEFKVYGGFFKQKVQLWRSFQPSADGPDTVSTTVAAGVTLHEQLASWVADGIATTERLPDGGTRVTYRGVDRGAYLSLGDLQKSAATVLRFVLKEG